MNDTHIPPEPARRPSALLVIDLQRAAFDGVRCPPVTGAQALVDRAVALVEAARKAGAPVVFVQHAEGPGEPFEAGSVHAQLHERLLPQPGDAVVHKTASSAFDGTVLSAELARLGAQSLVLCGLQSEFCVSNTARSALALGHPVTLARDAHGTWPSQGKSAAEIAAAVNDTLQIEGACLRSTDMLLRDWPVQPSAAGAAVA